MYYITIETLSIQNIMPTWGNSIIQGIIHSCFYLSGLLVVSLLIFLSFFIVTKKRETLNISYISSFSLMISSSLAFIISLVFFSLYLSWLPNLSDYYIKELPIFLIPFCFLLVLSITFSLWFIFAHRKKSRVKLIAKDLLE